jgi:hypothetical protein
MHALELVAHGVKAVPVAGAAAGTLGCPADVGERRLDPRLAPWFAVVDADVLRHMREPMAAVLAVVRLDFEVGLQAIATAFPKLLRSPRAMLQLLDAVSGPCTMRWLALFFRLRSTDVAIAALARLRAMHLANESALAHTLLDRASTHVDAVLLEALKRAAAGRPESSPRARAGRDAALAMLSYDWRADTAAMVFPEALPWIVRGRLWDVLDEMLAGCSRAAGEDMLAAFASRQTSALPLQLLRHMRVEDALRHMQRVPRLPLSNEEVDAWADARGMSAAQRDRARAFAGHDRAPVP